MGHIEECFVDHFIFYLMDCGVFCNQHHGWKKRHEINLVIRFILVIKFQY